MAGSVVVLSGASSVGKGRIKQLLLEDKDLKLMFAVSMTTRPQKEGEVDGVDYYFTDRAGNVKPNDYEITFGDEDLILVLIVKAPEERYFGARYDESKE